MDTFYRGQISSVVKYILLKSNEQKLNQVFGLKQRGIPNNREIECSKRILPRWCLGYGTKTHISHDDNCSGRGITDLDRSS
jgi:hypothetical protein